MRCYRRAAGFNGRWTWHGWSAGRHASSVSRSLWHHYRANSTAAVRRRNDSFSARTAPTSWRWLHYHRSQTGRPGDRTTTVAVAAVSAPASAPLGLWHNSIFAAASLARLVNRKSVENAASGGRPLVDWCDGTDSPRGPPPPPPPRGDAVDHDDDPCRALIERRDGSPGRRWFPVSAARNAIELFAHSDSSLAALLTRNRRAFRWRPPALHYSVNRPDIIPNISWKFVYFAVDLPVARKYVNTFQLQSVTKSHNPARFAYCFFFHVFSGNERIILSQKSKIACMCSGDIINSIYGELFALWNIYWLIVHAKARLLCDWYIWKFRLMGIG